MENQGLLFIPDISGFTRFITQTEIQHSRLIIQELLEVLINSNELGLEISEIEGDAILFYKFGEAPELEKIYGQVEKMFCEFHRNLLAYEKRRYCQCEACVSAIDLSLKVITHYGEFTGYKVKNFNKLIGKDIIIAHQLLKNDIDKHEYWLVTKPLLGDAAPSGFTNWMEWNSSAKQTENGNIVFHYTQLSDLKSMVKEDPVRPPGFSKKIKVISLSKEYDTDIITMFHASGSFNYRSRWREDVLRVEELDHLLPRVGMRCRCIMKNGSETIYSSSYYYRPDHIEFSETDTGSKRITYYTLEKIAERRTKLTMDIYIDKNKTKEFLFDLIQKKKLERNLQKSMDNLVELVKEIKLPGRAVQESVNQ